MRKRSRSNTIRPSKALIIIKKASTTRLENEHGNNKVQTWIRFSIRPSKALVVVKELWQQD